MTTEKHDRRKEKNAEKHNTLDPTIEMEYFKTSKPAHINVIFRQQQSLHKTFYTRANISTDTITGDFNC